MGETIIRHRSRRRRTHVFTAEANTRLLVQQSFRSTDPGARTGYLSGKRSRVVLEDISGKRETVDYENWHGMEMVLHSPVLEKSQEDARELW